MRRYSFIAKRDRCGFNGSEPAGSSVRSNTRFGQDRQLRNRKFSVWKESKRGDSGTEFRIAGVRLRLNCRPVGALLVVAAVFQGLTPLATYCRPFGTE